MVAANCMRCGVEFTGDDQDAVVLLWGAHQDAKHAGLSPMFSFSQPQDAAVSDAGRAAIAVMDGNAATMTDRTVQALTNLETAAQNWGTLTAAQKDQALRLTVQVMARLVRLVLRRLDTAI